MVSDSLTKQASRRTIILLVLTEFFWGMGAFFVLPTTTVPTYLRSLGAPSIVLGITFVALASLPMLLGFFARSILQKFPHRKHGLIIIHAFIIAPYLVIPIFDNTLLGHNNALLIVLIIVFLSISQLTFGLVTPVWADMIAKVIPPGMRGRYFGITAGALAIGGLFGSSALLALQNWLGAQVFKGAFLAAGLCFSTGMFMFWLTTIEEDTFNHPREPSLALRLRKALAVCSIKNDFGRFVASYGVQTLACAIIPFLIIFATDKKGLGWQPDIFGSLTLLQAVGGSVGSLILGLLADKKGSRWSWVAMTILIPVILMLYPFGARYPVLAICTVLVGILYNSWAISSSALLEFSPEGDKSGFVAVGFLIGFPGSVIGPLLMAFLIETSGYKDSFLAAVLAGLLAFAIALTIRGHHHMKAKHSQGYNSG